ncbi:MAG: hypothetical protein ACE5KH_03975 [Candidatus Geothermarchaeales archaeon]
MTLTALVMTFEDDGTATANILADLSDDELSALVGRKVKFFSERYGDYIGKVVGTDGPFLIVGFDPPPKSGMGQGSMLEILD